MTASWSVGRTKKYPYYRGRNEKNCDSCKKSFNGHKMEKQFVSLLKKLQPSENATGLVEAIFLEEWNSRAAQLKAKINKAHRQLKELDEEQNRLISRVAGADKEKVARAYEKRVEEIDDERQKLLAATKKSNVEEEDFGTALQAVFSILKNPSKYWIEGDFQRKRLVLKLVFNEPITYSPENGFGTGNLSIPVRLFKQKPSKGSQYVEMGGVEPPSELGQIHESTVRSHSFDLKPKA